MSVTVTSVPLVDEVTVDPSAGVTITVVELPGGPSTGGVGAVDSVNGQTGVVVLDASDVGADATGAATGAVSTHAGLSDPHPGYLTPAEGNAAYDTLGAAATAQAAAEATAAGALSTHAADTTSVHGIADTADLIVEGDTRLTDSRPPTAHATSHQDGGTDELALDGSQVTTGTVADARIASTIARDSEVAAAYQPLDADLTTVAALDSSTAGALVTDGAGWIRKTYAQLKTALSLVKADVGLGSVDNTADTAKPVSTAQQTALDLKANLASPTFTGTPAAPTPAAADSTTKLATTAFVQGEITAKAPLASPTFTGDPKAPTASPGDNDTSLATTAFVTAAVAAGGGGGAWNTWTPAIVGSTTSPTLGTGSVQWGEYLTTGELVEFWGEIAFGSSGINIGSGRYDFTIPVAAHANFLAKNAKVGTIEFADASAQFYVGAMRLLTSTTCVIQLHGTSSSLSHTTPVTPAVNDAYWFRGSYRKA